MMTSPVNVLLIEDNPADARLVREELKFAPSTTNFQLEWADCLEAGLERLTRNHLHAVLLDLSLPDSEGMHTLKAVLGHAPLLPVVVMTGYADEELGTRAVQAGAQDYLIKGQVDGRLLTRAIQYAIQRKRIELQLADAREFTERIVGSAPVGIFTYRLSGECLSANEAASQMVGGTIEQLMSQNFHQIESWKRSGLYQMAEKAIGEQTMVTGDVHMHTSFGREAWYQAQLTTFKSGGEELLLMMFVDITERKQMEEALRQREALLQQTQAIAHIGSWDLDLLGNRLTWSDEVYRIFGLEPRIFEGTYEAFLTAVHPDDRAKVDEAYSQSVHQGLDGYEIQHRITRQDTGEVRYVLEKCENIKDASGKIVRSVGMAQDITERWKSEAALQASERFNRATLDALTATIAILDETGTIVAVNRSWREFARANGTSPQRVSEGVNYLTVCDTATGSFAEEAKAMAAGIRAVLRGEEQSFAIEYPCHSPDEKRWFVGRVTRFQEGPLRIVVAHEYITERKLAEEALRESEENYRQLFEAESDAILLIDNETGQILQANQAACALYGYSPEQMLGKKNTDLSAEPEQTRQVTLQTPVVPEQVISIPLRFHRRKDGSIFPVELTGRFFLHRGRPVHIAAVRDITERKRAEAALEASEKRFRTWIEHSSDLVTVLDVNGIIHYQSPSSAHLLGYAPEDLVNTSALDLLHPDDREMIIARFFEAMQGVEASSLAECRVRHRDGTWRFLEAVGRTFVDEHGEMVALINSRDITERKEAAGEVAAMQRRFQSLIENAPDGIALLGLDGKLRQVTPSTQQILGYSIEEAAGQEPGPWTHPEDLPALLEQLNNLIQAPGKVIRTQYRFRHKDGSWRWLDSTISNLIAEPSVQAIVFNYRDITPRKELEEQLRQSEATLRSFYESAPSLMGITELAGEDDILHIYDNPATCRFFSVEKDATNGRLGSELGAPASARQEWIRHYHESERLGVPVHFEYLHEDGRQPRWLSVTVAVIPNAASAQTRFCYVAEEITERKQAEEKMVLQANLLGAVGSAAIATDVQGHVIYWNTAAEKLYGWTASEAVGRLITHLTPAEQSQDQAQEIMQHMLAGNAWSGEFMVKRKDGSWFPAFVSNSPFLDSSGSLIGFIGVSNDISELKNAEAALRASEQRYRDLAENFPNGVVSVYNREFQMVFDAGLELKASGYKAEDFIGKHFAELTTPETWQLARPHLQEAFEGKVSMYEAQGLDDQYYRVNVAPLYDSNREINEILVVSQNITNLKMTEFALREKEHLLSEAQRIGQIGSWSYDIPTDTIKFSDEMYRLLDILPDQFRHNSKDFLSLIFPADRPVTAAWLEDIKAGTQATELNFRIFRKNGELRYLHCIGAVNFDRDGNPIRFIGTTQDITERQVAELQIKQQIRRLKALAEIDRAIMSSYDLRYILGMIISQLISELNVDAADILPLDDDGQDLSYASGTGFRTKMMEAARIEIGESLAGRAAKERRTIRVADLKEAVNDPRFHEFVQQEGFVSYVAMPLISKGRVKGVLEVFQRTPLQPYQEWLDFFDALAGQAAIAIENAGLFGHLQAAHEELVRAYDATIEGWSRMLELHDRETKGHTVRVTNLALELARAMQIDESRLIHLRRGALLHDIGKLGVPDSILLKPGNLNDEERETIQKHPELAYEMLSSIEYLKPALSIPLCHHERWDGSGYPMGLRGEQIPLEARIFAVVDVWDALRSDRPYRPAWTTEKVLEYISDQAGKQFDPQVVDCFLKTVRR